MREMVRGYLLDRLGGRHRRGYGYRPRHPGPYGYGRRRRPSPLILGRPRRRTRVRVGGCCLPIPLGLLLGSTVVARLLLHRR
jgi:hypothetical protein